MNKVLRLIKCGIILFFLLFSSVTFPEKQASASEGEFPQANFWAKATPAVVWCGDPTSTTTLEVHIVGRNDVKRVWMTGIEDIPWDATERRGELFDDGTHGDLVAGDNIFTRANVALMCDVDPELDAYHLVGYKDWGGYLRVELDDGTPLRSDYGLYVARVNPIYKHTFPVKYFGNGLSATRHAFFIEDKAHEVIDNYPVANVICGTPNFGAYPKLYSIFGDDFDLAVLMPGMQLFQPNGFGETPGYSIMVSNAVQNIGVPIFDNTANLGSDGRLKSVVYVSFGAIDILDHEIGHTWNAFIGKSLGISTSAGHWKALTDVQGQMGDFFFTPDGSFQFADNGDGTWHLIKNTDVEPYSPLELYTMGFIPPEDVPPIHILVNPDLTEPEHVTAESYTTVTIEDIIAAEGGARIPSYLDAQKDFKVAFIVTQDYPYNDAAYAYFSLLAKRLTTTEPPTQFSYFAPFHWATGGRGTLETALPVDLTPSFTDVSAFHWSYQWIERLYNAKVTSGCSTSPRKYCPEQHVTRAEMAKFLLTAIHGEEYAPPDVGSDTGFLDVSKNYWAAAWIKQLGVEGITSGCGGGNFCPENKVTRAEMAKFLLSAKNNAGYTPPGVGGTTGFYDVPTDYWAAAWIKQLAQEGITSGCGGGNYCPENYVTRGEMAKFLVNNFDLP